MTPGEERRAFETFFALLRRRFEERHAMSATLRGWRLICLRVRDKLWIDAKTRRGGYVTVTVSTLRAVDAYWADGLEVLVSDTLDAVEEGIRRDA